MSHVVCLIFVVTTTLTLVVRVTEPAQAPPPRVIPLLEWVKQLDSDEYVEREAAVKRLSRVTLDPPAELLAMTRSENQELRARALKVAQSMRWNVGATRLERGQRFAERGEVDLFVAATAVWELDPKDTRLWNPALALNRVLLVKSKIIGGGRKVSVADRLPAGPAICVDFAQLTQRGHTRFTRVGDTYRRQDKYPDGTPMRSYPEALQSAAVEEPWSIWMSLVVTRSHMLVKYSINDSLVFANGNVTVGDHFGRSVIICDGDVDVSANVISCLIIARGNIKIGTYAQGNTLIAGGKVSIKDNEVLRWPDHNVIAENEPNPLGFITFFELSRVGVDVKVADGSVHVNTVADGKPFAKAGVKIGDAVVEVNGKKPDSAESLRRLLRDALAVGDATITIRRGDKTEVVKVALPE